MIRYFAEETILPDFDHTTITLWLGRLISIHGKTSGEISYIFCNDNRILEINKEFLNHDFYTDIITFDYSESSVLSGDIYISIETVASNAKQMQISFDTELKRVIAHGILHLCGFKDKTTDESAKMRKQEDAALELIR